MKCPSCSTDVSAGALECLSCGVNFKKWEAREARKADEIRRREAQPPSKSQAWAVSIQKAIRSDPLLGRKVAAGVAGVWFLGGLIYWKTHRQSHEKIPHGTPTGEFAVMRDPQTGDLVHKPIRRLNR